MRRTADDRRHAAAGRVMIWPAPRVRATDTGVVFAGLGRIRQIVFHDGQDANVRMRRRSPGPWSSADRESDLAAHRSRTKRSTRAAGHASS
jgi:hypothetical protein